MDINLPGGNRITEFDETGNRVSTNLNLEQGRLTGTIDRFHLAIIDSRVSPPVATITTENGGTTFLPGQHIPIAISLDPSDMADTDALWWLLREQNSQWAYFSIDQGFQPGIRETIDMPLIDLEEINLFRDTAVTGNTTYYFRCGR